MWDPHSASVASLCGRTRASEWPPCNDPQMPLGAGVQAELSSPATTDRYRSRSLWLDTLDEPIVPRPSLRSDLAVDVAIAGAGFIGLWTAYWLARADPQLRIAVIEAEVAGFGAAGRNAGFVSAGIAGQEQAYLTRGGLEGIRRAERVMIEGIDVIGEVVAREGIDCGWVKGGSLRVATSPAQLERVRAGVESRRRRGLGEEDVRLLDAGEIASRVRIAGALGGTFTPHCARAHPGRLVRGLAAACERLGVQIVERTRAEAIAPGRISCVAQDGTAAAVRARTVVQATEAFTVELPGRRREFLPVVSHMLATEPLAADVWAQIGWQGCETLADQRHLFTYAQRTMDGRIAIGGRGAGYRLGSPIRESDERSPVTHGELERTLRSWFPAAARAEVTHRWGGVFAVPRDWSMSIDHDRTSGLARAGGLAGHGVVASSVCGRTLADLIQERDTELTSLPWVGHRSGRWEPEPARVVAQHLITRVLASADRVEDSGRGPAARVRLVSRFMPSR